MNKLKSIIVFITVLCIAAWTFNITVGICKDFSSPPKPAGGDTSPSSVGYYRISAYCPCELCCGKWADGYTASGVPAVGKIVAAPPDVPFGTFLWIPGYGTAVVQDRGGAITGNRLDVLFATHQEAVDWGVQDLMVTWPETDK